MSVMNLVSPRILLLLASVFTSLYWMQISYANDNARITITKTYAQATPIAVIPFGGEQGFNEQLSSIISQDLTRSGKFSSNNQLPQSNISSAAQLNPAAWSNNSTPYIVVGSIQQTTDKQLTLNFELVHTNNFNRLLSEQLQVPASRLRDAGHLIADKVYEAITGVKGDFSGKIAYILTTQKDNKPYYQLQVADTDGARPNTIFSSSEPLMSPTWSPNGSQLAYVSFESGQANIYLQDVYSAQRTQLTDFKGFSSAPAFSPDGKYLLFTSSMQGNADIYQMRLSDRSIKPLITHTAIDTEGSYTPDARSIIFTSDRGGTPQIYQYNLSNHSTKRLTFDGKFNGKAIMSNNLQTVALIHNSGSGRYQMSVLDLATGITQVLSSTFFDDSPAFSPNGTMLAYGSKDKGNGVLSIVSTDGQFKLNLPAQTGTISEPAWNPQR